MAEQPPAQSNATIDSPAWWLERARDAVRGIGDPAAKMIAYCDIVKIQADLGDINGAKETARMLTKASPKAQAYREIVAAQARAGDFMGATMTAAGINNNSEWKAEAYRDIARAQAEKGDHVAAKRTLEARGVPPASPSDLPFQSFANRTIAAEQAKSRDFAAALVTARGMSNLVQRATAFRDIAGEQAAAGDVAGALATIPLIDDDSLKVCALCDVAVAQAKANDAAGARQSISQAKSIAADFQNPFWIRLVSRTIAMTQAKSRDFEPLHAWIETIPDFAARVAAYIGAAEAIRDGKA